MLEHEVVTMFPRIPAKLPAVITKGPPSGQSPPAQIPISGLSPGTETASLASTERSRTVNDFPAMIATVNHVEPVPRRIRAFLGGEKVLDTTRALYVWEWPYYPQYYIPLADVCRDLLIPEGHTQQTGRGGTEPHSLRVGGIHRPHAARLLTSSPIGGLTGTVRFDWAALDAWFEEDEQVFVHPRSPYVRVDALRSNRPVRVELEGVVLADSLSPVMVFETGLPTRYYLSRTDVDFGHLIPTGTVTACPYKGVTSGYWSIRSGDTVHQDLAWAYDFPTRQLLPIAGMIAFYNEKVDIFLDGQQLERPQTHFFPADQGRKASIAHEATGRAEQP
jgi:uncharacterized protein (DUF427 family)